MTNLPDGFYERIIEEELIRDLESMFGAEWREVIRRHELDNAAADDDRHHALGKSLGRAFQKALDGITGDERVAREIDLYHKLMTLIAGEASSSVEQPISLMTSVDRSRTHRHEPPRTGLTRPWLFTAGRHEPSLLGELSRELGSVDHVDILVSFITWSGVRKLRDLIERTTAIGANGGQPTRYRILTTTYIGATEARAIEWLADRPGVEVRISLDGRRTRLHAKAWVFRRSTGFGTAYVGSANLSGAALTGGLEWTIKVSQAAEPGLFGSAVAHFETLWDDPEFSSFDPGNDDHRQSLHEALRREKGTGDAESPDAQPVTFFSIQPKSYQQEILDRLQAERRHGRHRNLLVAATGTGKTVIAAFDYKKTCEREGGRPRLLFVAHRVEILRQARATFIQVLRQPGFGSICAGGDEPESFDHCFCTVQSYRSKNLAERFGPDHWHTVIIDECHHMTAASYRDLELLQPQILLGLTATPERSDGILLDPMFDMRPDGTASAELRLWDAFDQQLLAPFEYYGCEDDTDLSNVRWDRRGSEIADLDGLLTGNDVRAQTILAAVEQYVTDPARMKALAFCVSVKHATYMAEVFRRHGLNSEVVTGETDPQVRRQAPARLADGDLQVICTCDLYNEGIDIPDVDTLLMLRPTQSPVLIQQQLGRGLRLADGKESCLILDLVGRHSVEFRFDRVLGLLSGLPRRQLQEAVEHGFSRLPPGCHIALDQITREQVLRNLRELTVTTWPRLVGEASAWFAGGPGRRDADFVSFLRDTGVELRDLYRGGARGTARGWAALRRSCNVESRPPGAHEIDVSRRLANLLGQDDPAWLKMTTRVAEQAVVYEHATPPEQRLVDAISGELFPSRDDPCPGRELAGRLADAPALRDEIKQLSLFLDDQVDMAGGPVPDMPAAWPFSLHAQYSLRSIALLSGKMAADSRHLPREGVIRFPDHRTEFLIVTLDKSAGFSASTSYHDYAISPERFHWQSQNSAGPGTAAGQRYIRGHEDGWRFQLFVRETRDDLYRTLGPVTFEGSEGEQPMSITWRLGVPLPLGLFRRYSVLRAS
jgi:superfamily II DNA or RNA helicase/HKD family nuclease